jgi:hypothetical protein
MVILYSSSIHSLSILYSVSMPSLFIHFIIVVRPCPSSASLAPQNLCTTSAWSSTECQTSSHSSSTAAVDVDQDVPRSPSRVLTSDIGFINKVQRAALNAAGPIRHCTQRSLSPVSCKPQYNLLHQADVVQLESPSGGRDMSFSTRTRFSCVFYNRLSRHPSLIKTTSGVHFQPFVLLHPAVATATNKSQEEQDTHRRFPTKQPIAHTVNTHSVVPPPQHMWLIVSKCFQHYLASLLMYLMSV